MSVMRDDVQEAFRIEVTDVPGVQPASAEYGGIRLRALPVAEHVLRAAHAHLAGRPRGQRAALLIRDAHLGGCQRPSGALGVAQKFLPHGK